MGRQTKDKKKKKVSGSKKFTEHAVAQLKRDCDYSTRSLECNKCVHNTLLADVKTECYESYSTLIHQTFGNCKISKILQVFAPQLYGMYLLRMEEMKLAKGRNKIKEYLLFHVTTESRALESLDNGLDWRRTRRSKYGCGVSFSHDADYSNFYAKNSPGEDKRVIMICSVLASKTHQIPRRVDGYTVTVPPGNADTTMSHNGRVYVKYNDYDFYPLYFVHYRRIPEHTTKSKYYRAKNSRRTGLEKSMRAMNL